MSFWDQFVEGLEEIGAAIADWAPRIIVALIVLVVGWWIARILRNITRRLLAARPVAAVLDKAGITGALEGSGYEAPKLGAGLVYFYLWLVVLLITFRVLTVDPVVDLLTRLLAIFPVIILAFVILALLTAAGAFVAQLVAPWAQANGVIWLPWLVRAGFILFGIVTAMDLLGIGYFTNAVTTAIFGGAGVAFAIAFGVGGIDTARKWWAKYLSPSE